MKLSHFRDHKPATHSTQRRQHCTAIHRHKSPFSGSFISCTVGPTETVPPIAPNVIDTLGGMAPEEFTLPAGDLNLRDPAVVVDLFQNASQLNRSSPLRRGATVHLPDKGRLWMPGDLHDHTLNFQRLLKFAQLHRQPDQHLVLHELVHGPRLVNGCDLSIRLAARIAALKVQYPAQVHLMLANHDLAQVLGNEILKDGHGVVAAFNNGLEFLFGEAASEVAQAFREFVFSFNLAVRCANGVFCSHSLPSPSQRSKFDPTVIDRELTEADLLPGGSAYMMVWGRHHQFDLEEDLADRWNVEAFVMGHQPADMGYEIEGNLILILASDHEHGMVLPIDLSKKYDRDQLVGELLPLAGVL